MGEGSTRQSEYREIVVAPKAARHEALALVAAIGVIIVLMGWRFSLVRSTDTRAALRNYQLADIHLKNQAPILYRSLMGVVMDIEDLREENGSWPEITLLEEESLPPFAVNFLPMGLRGFICERHTGEGWVDYFGVNRNVSSEEKKGRDPLENSFLLRIIDLQSKQHPHPHSGQDNDPSMRFSFQVWMNPQVTDYPGENLVERGWKWVVSSSGSQGEGGQGVISEQPGQ